MSNNHTHLGKSHTFTDRGADSEILLRPGASETLQLGGSIDIVDLGTNLGDILINGVSITTGGGGIGDVLSDAVADSDLDNKIVRYKGLLGKTIDETSVKIRNDGSVREALGVYFTNDSTIRVDGDDADYLEIKADKFIIRDSTDATVFKYDLGNLNIGQNAIATQMKGSSFNVLSGTESNFYDKCNLYNNAGTYKTALEVYNSQSSDLTMRFPIDAGSANEVLKTDGTGQLDWVAQTVNTDTDTIVSYIPTINVKNVIAKDVALTGYSSTVPLKHDNVYIQEGDKVLLKNQQTTVTSYVGESSVTFGKGTYGRNMIVTGSSSSRVIVYRANLFGIAGTRWDYYNLPSGGTIVRVKYIEELDTFFALGDGGTSNLCFAKDPTGTWTASTTAITTDVVDIAYNHSNGTLVLVNSTDQIYYSTDSGITWTSVSTALGNELTAITSNSRIFVASSQEATDDKFSISNDGITWFKITTASPILTSATLSCIHYSKIHQVFIAGISSSSVFLVLVSTNGIDWTLGSQFESSGANAIQAISSGPNGTLYAVTSDDNILKSYNGYHFTPFNSAYSGTLTSIIYNPLENYLIGFASNKSRTFFLSAENGLYTLTSGSLVRTTDQADDTSATGLEIINTSNQEKYFILESDQKINRNYLKFYKNLTGYKKISGTILDDSIQNKFYNIVETVGTSSNLFELQWIDNNSANLLNSEAPSTFSSDGIIFNSAYSSALLYDGVLTNNESGSGNQFYDDATEQMAFGRTLKDAPKTINIYNDTVTGDLTDTHFDLGYGNYKAYSLTTDANADQVVVAGTMYKNTYTLTDDQVNANYMFDNPRKYLIFKDNGDFVTKTDLLIDVKTILAEISLQNIYIYDLDDSIISNDFLDPSASTYTNPTYPLIDDTSIYYGGEAYNEGWNCAVNSPKIIKSMKIKTQYDETKAMRLNNTSMTFTSDTVMDLTADTGTVYVVPHDGRFEIRAKMALSTGTGTTFALIKQTPYPFDYKILKVFSDVVEIQLDLIKGDYIGLMIYDPVVGDIIDSSSCEFIVRSLDDPVISLNDNESKVITDAISTNVSTNASNIAGLSVDDLYSIFYRKVSIAVANDTAITFPNSITNGTNAPTISSGVVTIHEDGLYNVTYDLSTTGNTTFHLVSRIYTSSHTSIFGKSANIAPENYRKYLSSSATIYLEDGDTVWVKVYQYSGGSMTWSQPSGGQYCTLAINKVPSIGVSFTAVA